MDRITKGLILRACKTVVILSIFAVSVLLQGCSGGSPGQSELDISGQSDIRASLNYDTGEITYPLSAYTSSAGEATKIKEANNVLIARCLSEKGIAMPLNLGIMDQETEDRRYGIWQMSTAEQYGYEPPQQEPPADPGLSDPTFGSSFVECRDSVSNDILPLYGTNEMKSDDLLVRAAETAYVQAAASPRWHQAREDWAKCLEKNGLSVNVDDGSWVPGLPESAEERIRVAIQDIECKKQTGMIQKLADLESKYQAAFIDQNQSAFNQLQEEKQAALVSAQRLVSEGI